MSDYIATIGIECHVQLRTKTKLFAGISNDAREAAPNTLVSHICLGMPGALPYLNEAAVELACRAAFALQVTPQKFSKFDRKHYFYPDLPKGYQISQLYNPIILGGHVNITVNGETRKIGITRAHLEEDAGKSSHPEGQNYSLVDLNRAGTPLLEVVSEPDIHTAQEAAAYARELYLLMRYAGVTDGDLYHGNMRFDVNVSVSKDPNRLGQRTETKNLNSFKSIEKAVIYEIDRQTSLLEKGEQIVQETRGWDDAKQRTFSQRSKEDAHDYRYMPDPDIPPVLLDNDYIEKVKSDMPVMPGVLRAQLSDMGIDSQTVDILLNAELDYPNFRFMEIVLSAKDNKSAKYFANMIANVVLPFIQSGQSVTIISASQLEQLQAMVESGKLSSSVAKELLTSILKGEVENNLEDYAVEKSLIQNSDTDELQRIVDGVLENNPKAVDDVKNGEMKAIGFLVGQVMKASKGQANPGLVSEIIKKSIN